MAHLADCPALTHCLGMVRLRHILWRLAVLVSLAWGPAAAETITVFAAASTKGPLDDAVQAFERQSGVSVVVSYAGTSVLVRQIELGAPADVFLSASVDWMDYLADRGRITPDTRFDVAANRLGRRNGREEWLSGG